MGANLCNLRRSTKESNGEEYPLEGNPTSSSLILNLIKPCCFNKKERSIENPKKKKKKIKSSKIKELTLEECLLNSPDRIKPDCMKGGELYVFKHLSRKARLSSSRDYTTLASTARDLIFSRESFAKADHDDLDKGVSSLLSENQSESFKLKKRVTFKLPEEADIILIYSPDKTFSDHEDSM